MSFELRYHPDVGTVDIPLLDGRLKIRIKTAIETRSATAPHQYGEPLRKTLSGHWKLRVGDYRVVFKIVGNTVLVLCITHRKILRGCRGPCFAQSAERQVTLKGYARSHDLVLSEGYLCRCTCNVKR